MSKSLVQQQFDMQALLKGDIDVAQAMSYNEYAQLLEANNPATGKPYTADDFSIIDWKQVGTSMLQDAVWANTERLKDKAYQDTTVKFLLATIKGWGAAFPRLTLRYDAQQSQYLIGIRAARVIGVGDALIGGVSFPVTATGIIVSGIGQLVTGQIPGGFFGPDGATGAIGIGALTYRAANQGLIDYLGLIALMSVALGVTNILPIPALDGGRMVVVMLEKVRGRPFNRDRELAVQRAGLVALLAPVFTAGAITQAARVVPAALLVRGGVGLQVEHVGQLR